MVSETRGGFNRRFEQAFAYAVRIRGPKAVSRTALGREVGIGRANIAHWFSGRAQKPAAEHVARAARFLGVSGYWLATGEGDMLPAPPKTLAIGDDEMALLRMYRAMPDQVRTLWRRQGGELLELWGEPSPDNPFGKSGGRSGRGTRAP